VSYRVRFTEAAETDLLRLYEFILSKEQTDWSQASRALDAIKSAIRSLELSPFSYRKASPGNPFLRELIIPFGSSGYVALFEIEDEQTVTILAVRHQLEEDYH
jgi:plasmid stabilization system protein ParE